MCRVTYVGHATVRVEMDGARLITDPLFRSRLLHLRRHGRHPGEADRAPVDAVLISHLHLDHADLRSLRELGTETRILGPPGAAEFLGEKGFTDVTDVAPGDGAAVGRLSVTATEADHEGRRWPVIGRESSTIGFLIGGRRRIYFAGDTDLFDGMGSIAEDLDLALLPVWGWGSSLGAGHLDPARAARAAALMRPRFAVPIHWGTLFPFGLERRHGHLLSDPPRDFEREAGREAPDTDVRVLEPGEGLDLGNGRTLPPSP